jgi:hypothetical protein
MKEFYSKIRIFRRDKYTLFEKISKFYLYSIKIARSDANTYNFHFFF